MNADPVVEAAHRAIVSTGSQGVVWVAEAAAREALAPLKELHSPGYGYKLPRSEGQRAESFCKHCEVAWPCATARLVYPASELS